MLQQEEIITAEQDALHHENTSEIFHILEHSNSETTIATEVLTSTTDVRNNHICTNNSINSFSLPERNEEILVHSVEEECNCVQISLECCSHNISSINEPQEMSASENNTITNEECSISHKKTVVVDTLLELLECPVCWNYMIPPIVLCECGHNVCFKCRPLMTRCPLCRSSFLNTRNVALEILARNLGLFCDHKGCFGRCGANSDDKTAIQPKEQRIYTCPLTFYTNCYWQGIYSEIRRHYEEEHETRILLEDTIPTWEINLVVREYKIIFSFDEIFFYKEKLDTTLSKFFIQVFYVGPREDCSQYTYNVTISSRSVAETFTVSSSVLPIEDLEHSYTYTHSHCSVLQYGIVNGISKYGDTLYSIIFTVFCF